MSGMLVPAVGSRVVTPSVAVPAVKDRMMGFDLVRGFAALAVIWVHAGRSETWGNLELSAIGASGTSYLNLLAGFFTVLILQKYFARGESLLEFAKHRMWRIYMPFLVWCVLYLLARVVNYALFGKVSMIEWSSSLLFHGTTYHLWFLPYLLIVTMLTLPVVAFGLQSRDRMLQTSKLLLVLACALLLTPLAVPHAGMDEFGRVTSTVLLRGPGFLIGLALGMLFASGYRPAVSFKVAGVCLALACGAMYLSLTTDLPKPILNRVAGVSAFVIALAPWRGRIAETVAKIGSLGFGVYLCHVLFVEGVNSVIGRAGVSRTLMTDLVVFGLVAILSFAFAYGMKKSRALSWLIP